MITSHGYSTLANHHPVCNTNVYSQHMTASVQNSAISCEDEKSLDEYCEQHTKLNCLHMAEGGLTNPLLNSANSTNHHDTNMSPSFCEEEYDLNMPQMNVQHAISVDENNQQIVNQSHINLLQHQHHMHRMNGAYTGVSSNGSNSSDHFAFAYHQHHHHHQAASSGHHVQHGIPQHYMQVASPHWGYNQNQHGNGMINERYYQQQQQQQQEMYHGYYNSGGGGHHQLYQQHYSQTGIPVTPVPLHSGSGGGCMSPGVVDGSHNTPSPVESPSDENEEHIRNNNVALKRCSLPQDELHMNHTGLHIINQHQHMQQQQPQQHAFMQPPVTTMSAVNPTSNVSKKPKASKRKKKRDPNEPQKPVSAYALFFRDSQASIKVANPNAAFGDVSKIVAAMWDALDPDNKAAYKRRTENAKKEYLKKLAAYRASLVSKGTVDGTTYGGGVYGIGYPGGYSDLMIQGNTASTGSVGILKSSAGNYCNPDNQPGSYLAQPISSRLSIQQQTSSMVSPSSSILSPPTNNYLLHMGNDGVCSSTNVAASSSTMTNSTSSPIQTPSNFSPKDAVHSCDRKRNSNQQQIAAATALICRRPGCGNVVQDGWHSEFCSNECVVGQCREVYSNWTSSGLSSVQDSSSGGGQYSTSTATVK